ncbi:MAG: hypothetical protein JXQ75_05885 [Phycisphaerae bacterium]|nr:hypothetical protein [Phycisphaerae bacterium]
MSIRDRASSAARVEPRAVQRRHYRIGPVSVTVRSNVPGVEESYHELYRAYEVDSALPEEFRVDVIAGRSWRTGRRYYHVLSNGEEEFTTRRRCRILPLIEGTINLLIVRHLPDYLQIHASALSLDGTGLVCAGRPGMGKSTLAAALLARGWSYATDEFALIDPQTRLLVPYPKALSIKSGSRDVLRRFGLPIDLGRPYERLKKGHVWCLDPMRVRPDAVARACPVRMIVFPQYGQGQPPTIEPMSRAQAVFELAHCSFNFLKFRSRAIELLVEVVRNARCYQLRTGDLTRSCRLIEDCFKGIRLSRAMRRE